MKRRFAITVMLFLAVALGGLFASQANAFEIQCPLCHGERVIEQQCPVCQSENGTTDHKSCSFCKNSGSIKIICPECDGDGAVTIPYPLLTAPPTIETATTTEKSYIDDPAPGTCRRCGGAGNIVKYVTEPCPTCDGTGEVLGRRCARTIRVATEVD